jgi:hypothetical protein
MQCNRMPRLVLSCTAGLLSALLPPLLTLLLLPVLVDVDDDDDDDEDEDAPNDAEADITTLLAIADILASTSVAMSPEAELVGNLLIIACIKLTDVKTSLS